MKTGIKGLLFLLIVTGASYAILEAGKSRGKNEAYRNCLEHFQYLTSELSVSKCQAVVHNTSFTVEYENIPEYVPEK